MIFEWMQKSRSNLTFKYDEKYDFKQRKYLFTSKLFINNEEIASGHGLSKKEAEQEAAAIDLKKIKDVF
jgi:dsRNA-specific ribonuclease